MKKFTVGTIVKHNGKRCTIIEAWNSGQGTRYYVMHSKWLWSVHHDELTIVNTRKSKA